MKIKHFTDVEAAQFESDDIKGVSLRILLGKGDGARNFWMRTFEIAPGGFTPKHSHDWEHEVFVHAGAGEVYGNGKWHPMEVGNVLLIPANEEHQMRNLTDQPLIFLCLVPSKAPESVASGDNSPESQ